MSSKHSAQEFVNPFETTATINASCADKELSESLKKELYGSDIKKEVEETLKALSEQANENDKGNSRKGFSVNTADNSHKAAGTLPLLRQELTTDAFIAEKREIGLVRMSLVAKRKEIHKLEEEVSRAEKRLRQQQEQLSSTRDKFNNYLKHSTLEQDAAVRRADLEAKAREEKTIEIKRLSALINRTEASIKKIELRLESCYTYKKFLDELTKPRWFYDVLIKMRLEKAMNKIVSQAESVYEEQAEQIKLTYHDAIQARLEAERSQRDAKEKGKRGSMIMTDLTRSLILSTQIVPLEEQLNALHSTMEQEIQQKVDALTESITKEVDALSLTEVRSGLEEFCDEAHAPSYFTEVDQLLEVFINVEEGNLFLIQNCQELEEELEGIALNYLNEKEDMESMTRQRHAQMEALANKIRTAQGKLRQLEDRSKMLEASSSSDAAAQGSNLEKSARTSVNGKTTNKENIAASLSPEGFKKCVEQSIANIFRTLTSGDNYFKALTAAHQQLEQKKQEQEQEEQEQHSTQQEIQQTEQEAQSEEKEQLVNGNNTLANKSITTLKATIPNKEHNSLTPLHNSSRGKVMQPKSKLLSGKSIKSPKNNMAASINAAISAKAKINDESGDAGANMGPIDMLTIIENKLEEYHRLIADPNKNVDVNLIANVMKQSDKERRRQARQEHMIQQAAEQEERVRKALLRSQAPVVKRTGKPVLPRSHLPTMPEDEEANVHNSSNLYKNGSNKSSSRSNNNNNGYQRRHRRKNNGNGHNTGKNNDAYYSNNNNRSNNDDDDDDDGEEFFR